MSELIILLAISSVLSLWLLLSVCLFKISSERNYSPGSKVMAFVPVLNMILVSRIVNTGFWKLFLPIIGLTIVGRIIEALVVNSFGYVVSDSERIIYLITIFITSIPPVWYLWGKVAAESTIIQIF